MVGPGDRGAAHPSAKDVPLVSTPATKCHEPCDIDSSVTLTERRCCFGTQKLL